MRPGYTDNQPSLMNRIAVFRKREAERLAAEREKSEMLALCGKLRTERDLGTILAYIIRNQK